VAQSFLKDDEVQHDDDDDGDDLPSPGRNFPDRFLPTEELFSLGIFRPAEAAVSISEPPRLRFSGTMIYARGRWQWWARVASPQAGAARGGPMRPCG
jgi:hypothetical protein